jgi:hypothetical protein
MKQRKKGKKGVRENEERKEYREKLRQETESVVFYLIIVAACLSETVRVSSKLHGVTYRKIVILKLQAPA